MKFSNSTALMEIKVGKDKEGLEGAGGGEWAKMGLSNWWWGYLFEGRFLINGDR